MRADLIGVDLSEGMLVHAKERMSTTQLVKVELTDYLRDNSEALRSDRVRPTRLCISAIWKVSSLPQRGRCGQNGLLVFTLEHDGRRRNGCQSIARSCTAAIVTRPSTSERVLAFAGLQPEIAHAELRMESGAPVAGLVIRATKSVPARR